MARKEYPVLSPVLADRVYKAGETIVLEEKAASELLAIGAIGAATGDAPMEAPEPLKANEAVALAKAAATVEDLDKLAQGETRKSVTEAIAARRKELGAAGV